MQNKPELLAPAGNVESFYAAVENGADAIYLGLKKFNARASAPNFTLEETASLIPFAHRRGIRIYVTVNSIVAATEVRELLGVLDSLSSLAPDALIVQDAGVFYLVRHHFPRLKLHASTLTTAHNSSGVNALERMGANRVVLARELNLTEIEKISSTTKAELEVFVHGALCYSYSGLCLTSSYRGGRSGLRGECVQPCRLKFRQGRKEGFFISCNDLCALPLLGKLKKLRISAFKIEGRMKSAQYIANVVRAYRGMLDAQSPNEETVALARGMELLAEAPSRHLTSGYFDEKKSSEILTPHRSGSSGIWIATVKSVLRDRVSVDVRYSIAKGDRLRPESSTGKEEEAFTVTEIYDVTGSPIESAAAGMRAFLPCSKRLSPGDKLFKIGAKSESSAGIWKKINRESPPEGRLKFRSSGPQRILAGLVPPQTVEKKAKETLILKIGSIGDIVAALQSPAGVVLLSGTRNNLERLAKQRFSPVQMRKIGIALPALLSEEKDLEYYRAAVKWFISKGFLVWEMNNWAHFDFVGQGADLRIIAGSRLNLRNAASLAEVTELGCRWKVLSLEVTKEELERLGQDGFGRHVIVPVFGWPPLFVSRLAPNLSEEKPFLTARGDAYFYKKQAGHSLIYADRPVSWLDRLPEFRALGFSNFLIDLTEGPGKRPHTVDAILGAFAASRSPAHHSLFNLERRP